MIPTLQIGQFGRRTRLSTGGLPGLAPDAIGTTPTIWIDGDTSPQYKGISTSDGLCTADGDVWGRGDSISGATIRCIAGTGGFYEVPAIGPGKGFSRSALGLAGVGLYNRPTGTANPSVAAVVSAMFSASAQTTIAVVQVNAAIADNGVGARYSNGEILNDSTGGYMGLTASQSGGTITFWGYNYDGSEDVVSCTIAAGTPCVVTRKLGGGTLRIRLNGVEIASIASGNTQVTTGQLFTGGRIDTITQQIVTYNIAVTDATLLQVEQNLGARAGLTI